jgi:WD40 repeat protein
MPATLRRHEDRSREADATGRERPGQRPWHSSRHPHAATGRRVGSPVEGHAGYVSSLRLAYLQDHAVVISSSGSEIGVRIRDFDTGQPLSEYNPGHTSPVMSIAVVEAGAVMLLASASTDRRIILLDPISGQAVIAPLVGHTGAVSSVAYARADVLGDAFLVTGGQDKSVRVWPLGVLARRPESPSAEEKLQGQAPITTLAAGRLHGRNVLVTGHLDGARQVWPVEGDGRSSDKLPMQPEPVTAAEVGVLVGRDIVATVANDGTVLCWDPAVGHDVAEPLMGDSEPIRIVKVARILGRDRILTA